MQEEIRILSRIAPDLLSDIGRRAQVLTGIASMQPVGRRALSARLQLPEREVRAAAAALKEQGLISMDAAGMQLTPQSQDVLLGARELCRMLFGFVHLEEKLTRLLKVPKVVVVPGNADSDTTVLHEVGRAAAIEVRRLLSSGMTLAVGGGGTMSEVAHGMQALPGCNIMVLPARGGMGTEVEFQANTVAAEIANRLGGRHRAIHLPDTLDAAALQEMLRIPDIQETLQFLHKSDLMVHGIGRADKMARDRCLSAESVHLLETRHAVGESFGDFFDFEGHTVLQANTVTAGLGLTHADCRMAAVAAGEGKAEAIIAVLRHDRHALLVTDEAAARKIIALLDHVAP